MCVGGLHILWKAFSLLFVRSIHTHSSFYKVLEASHSKSKGKNIDTDAARRETVVSLPEHNKTQRRQIRSFAFNLNFPAPTQRSQHMTGNWI